MSGIYFFNNNDFTLRQSMKGKLLGFAEDYKGIYLVLFYSKECKFCDELMSEFKQLPKMILGCKFVMVNINQNPEIIDMSKQTISYFLRTRSNSICQRITLHPIRWTNDLDNIKNFVLDISTKLEKTSFLSEEVSPPPAPIDIQTQQVSIKPEEMIQEYTIGKPLCGSNKDVYGKCYLGFESAYITS